MQAGEGIRFIALANREGKEFLVAPFLSKGEDWGVVQTPRLIQLRVHELWIAWDTDL